MFFLQILRFSYHILYCWKWILGEYIVVTTQLVYVTQFVGWITFTVFNKVHCILVHPINTHCRYSWQICYATWFNFWKVLCLWTHFNTNIKGLFINFTDNSSYSFCCCEILYKTYCNSCYLIFSRLRQCIWGTMVRRAKESIHHCLSPSSVSGTPSVL